MFSRSLGCAEQSRRLAGGALHLLGRMTGQRRLDQYCCLACSVSVNAYPYFRSKQFLRTFARLSWIHVTPKCWEHRRAPPRLAPFTFGAGKANTSSCRVSVRLGNWPPAAELVPRRVCLSCCSLAIASSEGTQHLPPQQPGGGQPRTHCGHLLKGCIIFSSVIESDGKW